jgi:hypothetical protein
VCWGFGELPCAWGGLGPEGARGFALNTTLGTSCFKVQCEGLLSRTTTGTRCLLYAEDISCLLWGRPHSGR